MQTEEMLRIGKKLKEELPFLVQPSKSDIALVKFYDLYQEQNRKWHIRFINWLTFWK